MIEYTYFATYVLSNEFISDILDNRLIFCDSNRSTMHLSLRFSYKIVYCFTKSPLLRRHTSQIPPVHYQDPANVLTSRRFTLETQSTLRSRSASCRRPNQRPDVAALRAADVVNVATSQRFALKRATSHVVSNFVLCGGLLFTCHYSLQVTTEKWQRISMNHLLALLGTNNHILRGTLFVFFFTTFWRKYFGIQTF